MPRMLQKPGTGDRGPGAPTAPVMYVQCVARSLVPLSSRRQRHQLAVGAGCGTDARRPAAQQSTPHHSRRPELCNPPPAPSRASAIAASGQRCHDKAGQQETRSCTTPVTALAHAHRDINTHDSWFLRRLSGRRCRAFRLLKETWTGTAGSRYTGTAAVLVHRYLAVLRVPYTRHATPHYTGAGTTMTTTLARACHPTRKPVRHTRHSHHTPAAHPSHPPNTRHTPITSRRGHQNSPQPPVLPWTA